MTESTVAVGFLLSAASTEATLKRTMAIEDLITADAKEEMKPEESKEG